MDRNEADPGRRIRSIRRHRKWDILVWTLVFGVIGGVGWTLMFMSLDGLTVVSIGVPLALGFGLLDCHLAHRK